MLELLKIVVHTMPYEYRTARLQISVLPGHGTGDYPGPHVRLRQICGNTFITQPARLKNSQVYCSIECGREGRRIKVSGKSRKTKPFGKQKAKVRDNFICKICKFDLVVHAHHIIPKKDGGSDHMDNIITLCPNHHAMAHAGLLSVEEMRLTIDPMNEENNKLITKARNALNFRAPVCQNIKTTLEQFL